MNKNGFTLTELLGVIVIIAIISGLAVVGVSSVIGTGRKSVYKSLENTLLSSSQNYFIENIDEVPSKESQKRITINFLIDNKYMDPYTIPDEGNCNTSYVDVSRENKNTNNLNLNYKVCLICKNNDEIIYKTSDDC